MVTKNFRSANLSNLEKIKAMIPKKIHFCWLSGDAYPPKIQKCIDSWKKMFPDYEIIKWDLTRFPIEKSPWVKEAFEAKKYAFAADYIRFYTLYTEGGIYLDSDVEVLKSFDDLLELPYFLGRENVSGNIEAAVMGCEAGAVWVKDCLDYYENRHFLSSQGQQDIEPLPCIMQDIFSSKYGIFDIDCISKFNFQCQNIQVLPFSYFSPKNYLTNKIQITENTYSIHHFTSAWRTKKDIFLNRVEGLWGEKVRAIFWLILRNPLSNVRGLLRLLKERKIWWN